MIRPYSVRNGLCDEHAGTLVFSFTNHWQLRLQLPSVAFKFVASASESINNGSKI